MNENAANPGLPEPVSEHEFLQRERELLEKARETAQRITQRVLQVLEDTNPCQSPPTEETPPLA